jgi:superfamily II DNA or RNA helicase
VSEDNSRDFEEQLAHVQKNDDSGGIEDKNNIESSIHAELDLAQLDESSAKIIDDALHFLKKDSVMVRSNNSRFNHAKCYIFNTSAVIGSSNFTGAGLSSNVELNAILRQGYAIRDVKEWFEKRWEEAQDSKAELIKILEDSKFGHPLEPFKMYMKLLYEYYKRRLEDLDKGKGTRIELTDFQRDAVDSAFRIIDKYGGVVISDSSGLGKTHIGLSLLREFASVRRNRVLLIAPRQVLDGVWEPRLLDESIKTKNESLEGTGTASFAPTDYLNYDVILIDESHNYRSASTNRYNNIMKVLSGGNRKQVILMTATPVNNSLIDLYNQIGLFTAGEDTHFAELGIPDLRGYFGRADRKQLASGVEDIIKLLDEIMIRRTRIFINENYPDATLEGEKITFPERRLRKVEYSLTNVFGTAVYTQVIETIDNLYMVPYRTQSYKITIEEKEKEEVEHTAALQKYGLLKRFESSIEAIRKSVSRLFLFYQTFENILLKEKIINSSIFHDLVSEYLQEEDELDDDEFFKQVEKLSITELQSTKEYDLKRMEKELKEDIKLLKPLKENLDKMQSWGDAKLNELKILFAKDKIFETGGKKVIIFTQFVDTANYLFEDLKNNVKDKKIVILTGKTGLEMRKRTLLEFAPKANNPEQKLIEREADILITSDVLSEGQNLQDANYAINYDLPWNPMKIVQRVGRVDRLTSQHKTVTSAVFFPERELEDELGLLIKLTRKIQKAAGTVGVESTILGEKATPKTFNAFERIKKEDPSLLDDMERSAELLPSTTPFQEILGYMKKIGELELKSIPYGKRSGKNSEESGLILCYKEKTEHDSLHFLFYDFRHKRFDHINDITWVFRMLRCQEKTSLNIPFEGFEVFRHIRMVDQKAREEIIIAVNAAFEARKTQKIKSKYQRQLYDTLYDAFKSGKATRDEVNQVFKLLIKGNYPAWEKDFKEFYEKFQLEQSIPNLVTSLLTLFQKFKIEERQASKAKELKSVDLILVGCMFLVNPSFKDWNILAA